MTRRIPTFLFFCLLLALAGCGSHVVAVNIVNKQPEAIRNVEVTFGGGSYGRSSIAAGATHRNRIKIFGTAPLQVQFDDASGKHMTTSGPQFAKNAEGSVTLTIDSNGTHWTN